MPMPLSRTDSRTVWSCRMRLTAIWPPAGVNLIAFETRFQVIWRRRSASPRIVKRSTIGGAAIVIPLASALGRSDSTTAAVIGASGSGRSCNRSLPVTMRDTSSRSSMSSACCRALRSMISSASDRRSSRTEPRPQHADPAEHDVQRSAELVRQRGEEFVLGPVGGLRLGLAFAQRLLRRAQLELVPCRGFPGPDLGGGDEEQHEGENHADEQRLTGRDRHAVFEIADRAHRNQPLPPGDVDDLVGLIASGFFRCSHGSGCAQQAGRACRGSVVDVELDRRRRRRHDVLQQPF